MDKFKTFVILLCLLFALLASASLAHADEDLNMPQPLKHDGLTFDQVLPEGVKVESIDKASFQKIEFAAFLDDIPEEPKTAQATPAPTEEATLTTPSPTPTPEKVLTPTPTETIKPTTAPTQITSGTGSNTSTGGGLNADTLFNMSNSYRSSHGLAPFQKDERICSLAAQRAPEIGAEISEGHMHSGKNSHNFPYWFTENIIFMNSEESAFNWWINDPIHHDAIVGNYTHSCVACSGNSCVQEFTSFQPK